MPSVRSRLFWHTFIVISPADPAVLALAESLPPGAPADLNVASRLRSDHDPEVVAMAMTQVELRERARAKFGERATSMVFTRDGLEQASRPEAATHHAAVFAQAGITTVREVGPGVGGDTLAFAEAGLAVDTRDLDPERVEIARHNLADFPSVSITCGDGLADLGPDGLWADPARRAGSKRLTHPESWSPPLSGVLQAARNVTLTGIKVAPGIAYEHLPPEAVVEWISIGGDLVEAIIWIGRGAPARRAIIPGVASLDVPGDPSTPAHMVEPRSLGRYVYDPDPALVRAGGLAAICTDDLAPVAAKIAYLTSDDLVESPWLSVFEVLEVCPLRSKAVSKALAARGVGRVEIKKRGVDVSPETFRSSLKLVGNQEASIILTPLLTGRKAIITRRIAP